LRRAPCFRQFFGRRIVRAPSAATDIKVVNNVISKAAVDSGYAYRAAVCAVLFSSDAFFCERARGACVFTW
jgi:hypothetical protein